MSVFCNRAGCPKPPRKGVSIYCSHECKVATEDPTTDLRAKLTAAEAESARLAALLTETREVLRRIIWAHDETDGGDLTEAIDASRVLLARLTPQAPTPGGT